MSFDITHSQNTHPDSHQDSNPKLSVLIPFYKDDPTGLLTALVAQSNASIEILIYDDGTGDTDLTAHVNAHVKDAAPSRVTLITAHANKGRSAARNHLQSQAKADWVLFLDADMRPQSSDFLQNYLDLIQADVAEIFFGGFTVLEHSDTPERELHRVLSETSDCLNAAHREKSGPQHVATSNLCVLKSVMISEGFDPDFTGWGWEDSEWAARVAQTYRLRHIDNPAIHLGLETTDTLLSRFRDSAQNYVRFTNKHPDLAKTLKLYSTAYTLKKVPGQALMRPLLKALVKLRLMPIKIRITALKLWRASWYADALPEVQI